MTDDFTPTEPPDFTPGSWRAYTLTLDYSATGEGVLTQVLVTMAASEQEARERFWETFWRGDAGARAHFGRGLTVQPGIDRERLQAWFTPRFLERLEELTWKAGALSLSLGWSFNLS